MSLHKKHLWVIPRCRRLAAVVGAVSIILPFCYGASPAGAQPGADASAATATTPSDVPYALPVTNLPTTTTSPSVVAQAPYTPAVISLIDQLEPSNPPTEAELANADALFHGGTVSTCNNVGPTAAPTGTSPSIMPMCWSDAQGVNVTSGPNVGNDTGPMDLMGLGATFDRSIANYWGQTEGTEGRELMVTGLFGPQTDIDMLPNWGRNLTTTGADPYLSAQMVAAQISGIQGAGLMSQMKHFAVYNGEDMEQNAEVDDQALHQLFLTPYEAGFVNGQAAATMCSYQIWQDMQAPSTGVPTLASTYPTTTGTSLPGAGGPGTQTWPLNEPHFSCEQPLTLTYALRDLWGSKALVGSDYPATHSTSAIEQGEDQEQPTSNGYFSASNSLFDGNQTDPTGDTCADASGNAEPCTTPGAVPVGGIPGPGCPTYGCTLVQAVGNGTVPITVFNQALATMLYQEQRFGMLGCNQSPVTPSCTNPGGVDGNQSGIAPLPTGPSAGATPAADLGTKNGDAAVVERESEEGGVLLKNDDATLPITAADLKGGVMVTGPGAQYTIADPTSEAAIGYLDRDQISPLQQLEAFTNDAKAFTYVPALDPVGEPVPSSALSTSNTSVTGSLTQTINGGLTTTASSLDFTTVSGQGQLGPGTYTWSGYVYVPTTDAYTFDFQVSPSIAAPTDQAITEESWAGGTATLTLPAGTALPVGSQIVVAGACPSGYDGTYPVTTSTATTVSYALGSNPGACNQTLAVTGASYSPGLLPPGFVLPPGIVLPPGFGPEATLNFAQTSTPPAVGSTIVVSGINPAGYNGTFTVISSTPSSVSYALSSNPGTYVSGGTIAVSATGAVLGGGVLFSLNGSPVPLSPAAPIYSTVEGSPTNAGYTEAGLTNVQYNAGTLTGGTYYPVTITFYNTTSGPASFRFGYNRANGDIADAAAAAKGTSLALVFLNDNGATTTIANPYYNPSQPISSTNPPFISSVASLAPSQTQLVEAVAAANPNTVVVLNTTNPVLMPWVANVKSVLEMWFSGEEGGTSTARLLLGLADPSGHLPITFPANATDTFWGYNETTPLYPGDTLGVHYERLNGNGGCSGPGCPADTTTVESEGIYTDYRFLDQEGITPLFPFGWGLSYTNFRYSGLMVTPASDGGLNVSVRVRNTGPVAGTAVPQVYLGAPPNPPNGVQFAVRQLVQFDRAPLQPGQSERVTMHVALRQLQYWDSGSQQWLLPTGDRTVWVGDADSMSGPAGDPGASSSLPLTYTIFTGGPAATTTCDDEQLSATVINGNLTVPAGGWCDVVDATIGGNLTVSPFSLGLRLANSTINGSIRSTGSRGSLDPLSSGTNVVCGTTVKGDIDIVASNKSSPWDIGLCGGNTVNGNVRFIANSSRNNSIEDNSILGDLSCRWNGSVKATGNSVKGRTTGQCR